MAMKTLGEVAVETVVKLNEGGQPVEFIVIQQGSPSAEYVGFDNGATLLRNDIQSKGVYDSTNNDYANSDLQAWDDNTYLNLLDPDIRDQIMEVRIPYRPGAGTSTSVASGANGLLCKVFDLSVKEVNGTYTYSPAEGTPFSYFINASNSKRIASYNGKSDFWWLRTPDLNGPTTACFIGISGGISDNVAHGVDEDYGRRPTFVLPKSLFVQDDGTITTNQPPTAPSSIDVTDVVRGENATITLTAATDPDGTVASYIYERQVDGGAWQQVAQANSLTQTDPIGEDWGTVAYRACAVDDLGVSGPCITGETYTVNSGWVTIGGPAEDMGSQPKQFDFDFTVSVSGAPSVDAITVSAALDGAQIYSGTPSAGEQISVPVDTRLLGAGEHAIEVQASKDDYLPASRRYTFTIPAVTIPAGGTGEQAQGPDGRAVYHTTLAQRCIGTGGVDIQAQVNALTARVKTLEG